MPTVPATLSLQIHPAPLIGARRFPVTERLDYEDGPIHLNDTSLGLNAQVWRLRLIGPDVYLASANYEERKIYSARGIEEISLSFDQNGQYVLALLILGNLYVYQFDAFTNQYTTTLIETDVVSPRLGLDDRRKDQVDKDNSDIILAYIKNRGLYVRIQRDRFQTPYLVHGSVEGHLIKIGMGTNNRLQFHLEAFPRTCYSCTWPWGGL